MRLNDVRQWNHHTWTQLYEAALFERDTMKLCSLIWNAKLAILGREQEIQKVPDSDQREVAALRKALEVLRHLGRLSGLGEVLEAPIEFGQIRRAGMRVRSTRSNSRSSRGERPRI